jgi:hypothetical protein
MDGTTRFEIVGVFGDRGDLERAMDALEGNGIQRPQMSLLGTRDAVEAKLGLPLREVQQKPQAAADPATPRQEPIKRDEAGTLTGLMTMVPRAGPLSASFALVRRSWYHRGKSSC